MHPKYARLVRRSVEPQNRGAHVAKRGLFLSVKKPFFLKPKFLRRAFGVFILLVAVSWSFQQWIPSSKAFAAPWSSNHGSYGQRKQLTLVNDSGQTFESGTTYKVTIDTQSLYNTGSLLSTCDDLRVVYQPSNTTATELKRAVEYASSSTGVTTCGTSTATKVVFQLQANIANAATDANYYIYYDNTTATTYPAADALDAYNVGSKEATFVAPFNGTTTALAAGSGTPTTASGAIRYSGGKSALSFSKDYVDVNHIASTMTAADLTVEFWVNIPVATGQSCYSGGNSLTAHVGNFTFLSCGEGSHVVWGIKSTNQYIRGVGGSLIGQWHHIAMVRNSIANANYLYIDGVQKDTDTYGVGTGGTHTIMIGRDESYATNNGFTIDEYRISETARYTANFTPQTTPFVRDEYTKLLVHFDENGDDPRNTGKAIDDSGNGNHGTITGAKYVGGLIGVDGSSSNTSYQSNMSNQSYGSHDGVYIEEGTTNKITNPSFDHTTYNTNWSSPAVFDYDSTADTFTAGMAKRNSAGPFAAGYLSQGNYSANAGSDNLSFPAGTQINSNFYTDLDKNQGSIAFWITPEWNGNDGVGRFLLYGSANFYVFKGTDGNLALQLDGSRYVATSVSSWTAGSTYSVVIRWDYKNPFYGSNYASISINDVHTAGVTTAPTAEAPLTNISIGGFGASYGSLNAIIEGLTIYRRPLWDGAYGIDVGNGDEIAQIWGGSIAGSKDPTLVTGSWDVVFALPTNSSTGALATGTGNAWTHPHASNLLYTSTTNTGGFMMNGTAATDGWSEIPWYQVGGASGAVAAYQPIGAADLANSYVNKANPGTYNAAPGVAPTWDATNGWSFNGSTQWLNTGITAPLSQDWSMFARFSNAANAYTPAMGVWDNPNTDRMTLWPAIEGAMAWNYGTFEMKVGTNQSNGIIGIAGRSAYYNGELKGTINVASPSNTQSISIGKVGTSWYGNLKIQASAIYNTTLTSTQVANVTDAMEALSSSGTYLTPTALATGEKIFAGGYKYTSTGGNQGIYRSFTATNGGDYVVRAIGNADASCQPQVKVVRADGTTEVTHLNGASNTTRTAPTVYIFTFESPAAETLNVQLLNLNSSGTCYWHQVEVLSNLINNPSMEGTVADPYIPTGWSNFNLSAGESSQESTVVHSGSYSTRVHPSGTTDRIFQDFTLGNGFFTSFGGFAYGTGHVVHGTGSQEAYDQCDGTLRPVTNISNSAWQHVNRIVRTGNANFNLMNGSRYDTTDGYYDDFYGYSLNAVSLTVTPASEANSLETSGLRVDGTDTLTQPIDSLTATAGTIKFKFTPRHSWSVASSFGTATPTLADILYNTNDRIQVWKQNSTVLQVYGKFNGTIVTADWTNPTLNAGTTYSIEIGYATGGNLYLKVDGVQVASASMGANSFANVPNTAYFGSNFSGGGAEGQYEGTVSAPDFTGTITPTENTTAPYYKFGSKSAKLVASADGRYVTSINPGNVNTHTFSAYVYDGTSGNVGGTVSATVAKLVFNGSVVTPASYTDMGGGWWRLSYSAATANAAGDYGIAVLSGKTIYVDGVQLEEKAYATTYTDGTMGTGYAWTGTAHESTSTRTLTNSTYSTTNNLNISNGSVSMWLKPTSSISSGRVFRLFNTNGSSIGAYVGESFQGIYYYAFNGGVFTGGRSNCGATWTIGKWMHTVFTWEGTNLVCYVNSVAAASATRTSPTDTLTNVAFGSDTTSGNESNSVISDVKVYSSALTSTEVADLYYSGLGSHSSLAPVATERYTDGEPPVLAWHLNEGYGTTVYDSTIYTNSGTISGATWSDDAIGGSGGSVISSGSEKSLKFDGVDDKISRAYANDPELNPGTSPFSVSTWFKHPSTVTGTDTLISRYSSTGSGGGYKVYMNSSGFICFGVDDDTTWGPDDSACASSPTGGSYADSNWHHVLVNVIPSASEGSPGIYLYIDGVQRASNTALTITGSLSGSSPTFYVGIDSDGTSNPWDGFIDEVRVYNSARSEEQINQEYIAKGTNKGVSAQFGSGGASSTLSQGLVGHWKMDEASWNGTAGEVLDASGNGNNGVRSGDATIAAGKFGNGGTFDGTGDYVSVTRTSSIDPQTAWSLAAWVKRSITGTMDPVLEMYDWSDAKGNFAMRIDNDRLIAYIINGVTSESCGTTSTIITQGVWYLLTAVYDSKTKTLSCYVNGVSEATNRNVAGIPIPASVSLKIGARGNDVGEVMNGQLDEARIYNHALSPAEVRALYDYAPGPVAHYTFDEGSGQSAYDKSGNGNTGTLGASASPASDDPTWTNGKYGKALSFDGGDYVGSSPSKTTRKFVTIGGWVNFNSPDNLGNIDRYHRLFGWGYEFYIDFRSYTSEPGAGYFLWLKGQTANSGVANVNNIYLLPTKLRDWHYIAATYDGSTTKLFLDSALVNQTSVSDTGIRDLGRDFKVGGDAETSTYFDSSIDDVRIYNYARSQKQIVQDMLARQGLSVASAGGNAGGSAVAHYKFDEGQGTVAQNSGNGGSTLNGTLTNMSAPATSTSGWTNEGKFGKGVAFDGTNDYVDFKNSIPSNSDFTVSFWSNVTVSDTFDILAGGGGAGDTWGWRISLSDALLVSSAGSLTLSIPTQSLNTWHHYLLTRKGDVYTISVDGLKRSAGTLSGELRGASGGYIIKSVFSGYWRFDTGFITYQGYGDEFKVYNYALSEDEVKLEYNAGKAIVMGSLGTTTDGKTASNAKSRAYCPPGNIEGNCAVGLNPAPMTQIGFEENSGSIAYDESGNNNNGSFIGDAVRDLGKIGRGIKLDGNGDRVDFANNANLDFTNQDFTINSWFKLASYYTANTICKSSPIVANDDWGWKINVSPTGILSFSAYHTNSLSEQVAGTVPVNLNQYYYVTSVFSATDSKMYLYTNGIKVGETQMSSTAIYYNSPDSPHLGAITGCGAQDIYFQGVIDGVSIYPYSRTPAQIAWDYNKGAPLVQYKFNECSGTTINNSVPSANGEDAGNNGTLTVGASGTQTSAGTCSSGNMAEAWNNGTSGKISSSISFDGVDDYASIPDNTMLNLTTQLTLSGWIKTTDDDGVIIAKDDTTGERPYVLYFNSGQAGVYIKNTTVGQVQAKTVNDGLWHHVLAVFDAAALRLYVDGINVGTDNTVPSSLAQRTHPVTIGMYSGSGGHPTNGQIDDVRIYNYALSPVQVKDVYNNGAVSFK